MRLQTYVATALASLLMAMFSGCSGSSSSLPIPTLATVSVTPANANLQEGQTAQFTANISNSTDTAVLWEVNHIEGGNAQIGTISANGLYTAPSDVQSSTTMTITAAIVSNTSASGNATAVVNAPVAVVISPKQITVEAGTTQQFSAQVLNTSDTSVTWQVNGIPGGDSSVGIISSTGLYTAPDRGVDFSVVVTAVSNADPTKSDSAAVNITVIGEVTVTVNPPSASLITGQTQLFTATIVPMTVNQAVTWSVSGSGCQGDACGTVASDGTYTAPTSVPNDGLTVTITATSVTYPTKSGTATASISGLLGISITPVNPSLHVGQTLVFMATLTNAPQGTPIDWQLGCITADEGDGDQCGDIDNDGEPPMDGPGSIMAPNGTAGLKVENSPTVIYAAPTTIFPDPVPNSLCQTGNPPDSAYVWMTATASANGQTANQTVCIFVQNP